MRRIAFAALAVAAIPAIAIAQSVVPSGFQALIGQPNSGAACPIPGPTPCWVFTGTLSNPFVIQKHTITTVVETAAFVAGTNPNYCDFKYTVPAGKTYRIKSLFGKFTTTSGGSARKVSVGVWDGSGNLVAESAANQGHPAGVTYGYYAAVGVYSATGDNDLTLAIADMALPAGYVVGFTCDTTLGSAAPVSGDAWSSVGMIMEDES